MEMGIKAERVWTKERTSILQKAIDIVGPKARGLDYGHPLDNFEMEAEFMNVWISHTRRKRGLPTNAIVSMMLDWKDMAVHKILMKITRECHRHKEDNSVDIAGYAWTLEEAFIENEKRRGNKS